MMSFIMIFFLISGEDSILDTLQYSDNYWEGYWKGRLDRIECYEFWGKKVGYRAGWRDAMREAQKTFNTDFRDTGVWMVEDTIDRRTFTTPFKICYRKEVKKVFIKKKYEISSNDFEQLVRRRILRDTLLKTDYKKGWEAGWNAGQEVFDIVW